MPSLASSITLSTKNLTIGYTSGGISNYLFENLNLTLYRGQLICFMGPNGIGKSTLLRTLAGLQKQQAGEITSGNDQRFLSKKIAVVLTDRITSVNMTVYELVTFGRYPYLNWNIKLSKEDKEIIDKSIELLHIQHLISKRLFELSDGQMQMVMIARALTQDGEIILLDEPTAHLDLNNRVEIMNLLRKLSRTTNKSILIATHELDLALQTADLIWLAGTNKNILTGIPEDLVLLGSFDEIFQFKGFDLKTGKVSHEPWRGVSVSLIGEGPEYLWTKNALERCGYKLEGDSILIIHIVKSTAALNWLLNYNNTMQTFKSLNDLLQCLSHL